jgi:hypothetical protein
MAKDQVHCRMHDPYETVVQKGKIGQLIPQSPPGKPIGDWGKI